MPKPNVTRKHSRRVTKKTLRLISNGRSVYEGARLQPIGAFCLPRGPANAIAKRRFAASDHPGERHGQRPLHRAHGALLRRAQEGLADHHGGDSRYRWVVGGAQGRVCSVGGFFEKTGGFIYEVFLMLVGWVTLVDVGRLGGWVVGWLVGWLVGLLVGWLGGREVGDFFFWLVVVIICCSLLFLLAFLIVPAIFWYMLALSVFFCHLNSLCFVFFTRVLRR